MSEQIPKYGVSYVASAPEELKVGDRVKFKSEEEIKKLLEPSFWWGISIFADKEATIVGVDNCGTFRIDIDPSLGGIRREFILRKLPDTISFEEDSDNVKVFKAILNEMAETYKAKDADYGSAYDDGYRLFGYTQLLSRIYEKFSRAKHLLDGNKPNVAENICDTLTDMSIQCIALRMLLQKNDFENVD